MALLRSMLLQLGLFLYLGLPFSSAISTDSSDNCMIFDKAFTSHNPGIKTNPSVFGSNTSYTVWVPVNSNVSTVLLQALDKNHNPVGTWQEAHEECNNGSGVLYHVTYLNSSFLQVHWIVPNSEDITGVELQAFVVNLNRTATFSSVKLGNKETTTTLTSTTSTFRTNPTTTKTTRTPAKTTSTPAMTTPSSLAVTAFSSPIAGAIHILLIFLTSKLLF